MSKTIQKPLNCRNARCGASCSLIDAEMWSAHPNKCPMFEYNPYIYDEAHDARVKAETIDKIEQKLRIWDNKANAIPEYVWHCINEVRKYHE